MVADNEILVQLLFDLFAWTYSSFLSSSCFFRLAISSFFAARSKLFCAICLSFSLRRFW